MPTTLDEVRLIRSAEAAEVLGVSRRQLDRLIAAGVIEPVRLTERGHPHFRFRDVVALTEKKED